MSKHYVQNTNIDWYGVAVMALTYIYLVQIPSETSDAIKVTFLVFPLSIHANDEKCIIFTAYIYFTNFIKLLFYPSSYIRS
jgi:hypothetical protein